MRIMLEFLIALILIPVAAIGLRMRSDQIPNMQTQNTELIAGTTLPMTRLLPALSTQAAYIMTR